MVEYKDELLEELKKDLEYYDRIVLIPALDIEYHDLFAQLDGMEGVRNSTKKLLILSTENLAEGNHYSCRRISCQEMTQLKELYLMYEFSDRFQLLTQERCFGGILNFVEAGILTKEEALRAILFE